jgi:hypothetical protein
MRNYYVPGEWNVVCMRCGFEHKASELREEWTGMRVCNKCYEPRHPQTLLRVPKEQISVPWSSPEPADTFIIVPYIGPNVGKQT